MSAAAFEVVTTTESLTVENVFEDIQRIVLQFLPAGVPEAFSSTVTNMVEYNSFGGKKIRLEMTLAAFKHFAPRATADDMYLAYVLGWITEIFQGAACIIDDVVDKGTHRRKKLSWHQLPQVGRKSIIDSHLMVCICELLLKHFFGGKSYYLKLLEVFDKVKWTSLIGESMESRLTDTLLLEEYTCEVYRKICYGRTSCYTFYFPVAIALAMVPEYNLDHEVLEQAASTLGFLYSVQDDFMDVYGDPFTTGKSGTDIQERKCSWLIVTALEKADACQKHVLLENYGSRDEFSVRKVKQIFEELEIRNSFKELTFEIGQDFKQMLALMPPTAPVQLYKSLFCKLADRKH